MKPQPMDTLISLAREARDTAGQLLAGENLNRQQLATQAELLHQYRDEYCQRLQEVMAKGVDVATLRNYQNFLASLDSAIDRARKAMDEQLQRVFQRQQQWQQEQLRLTSYDTLLTRRDTLRVRDDQRREQRQNDEITTNTFARERMRQASPDRGYQEKP